MITEIVIYFQRDNTVNMSLVFNGHRFRYLLNVNLNYVMHWMVKRDFSHVKNEYAHYNSVYRVTMHWEREQWQ